MAAKPKPLSNNAVIAIAAGVSVTFLSLAIVAYNKFHSQYFNIPAKFANISGKFSAKFSVQKEHHLYRNRYRISLEVVFFLH